jgi:hypothetical protein
MIHTNVAAAQVCVHHIAPLSPYSLIDQSICLFNLRNVCVGTAYEMKAAKDINIIIYKGIKVER